MDADHDVADAMSAPRLTQRAPAPPGFIDFYLNNREEVMIAVRYAGGTRDEAEEAAAAAMAELLPRFGQVHSPLAYARRVALNHLIQERTRDKRLRDRLVKRSEAPAEYADDPGLTVWENREWVIRILRVLPPAQRDVVALIVDEYSPNEVALLLGRNPMAVYRSLCDARRRLQRHLDEERDERQQTSPTIRPRPEETR